MRAWLRLAVWALGAADARAAESPPQVIHLTQQNGLSQNSVQAVVQDHTGYLWIGTEEGLNRYDGYAFRVYRRDATDPSSLPDNLITALFEDSQQRLWVGTHRGLCRYDAATDRFFPYPSFRNEVRAIVETPDHTVWVGSLGGALSLLAPSAADFATYVPDPRYPWNSLASFAVSALYVDHSGRLWVSTFDRGLDRFVPGHPYGSFVHYRHNPADPRSLSSDSVWGLGEDKRGQILAATPTAGLNVLDPVSGRCVHLGDADHRTPSDRLTTCFRDSAGRIWVGSDGAGLLQLDQTTGALVATDRGPKVVRVIAEDRQHDLWIGSNQDGLYESKPAREGFVFLPPGPSGTGSLGDAPVSSVLQDRTGRVWVGTENGSLDEMDPATHRFRHHRVIAPGSANPPPILALHEDPAGRIWVGTYNAGLAQLDPATGQAAFVHPAAGSRGEGNPQVWAIADAPGGSIWLGTNGGLDRYDPERNQVVQHFAPGPTGNAGELSVRSLLPARNGVLWIGSFGGLASLRPGAAALDHSHEEAPDAIYALHEDGQGRIWAGTLGGGLLRIDPETAHATVFDHLPSRVVYAMQEEPANTLWLSTNSGLIRFDMRSGSAAAFDLTNGLQTLQFHLGAATRLRDGRLLFGSVDGLSEFNPQSVRADSYSPAVAITDVAVVGHGDPQPRLLGSHGAIALDRSDRLLTVTFAALDFSFPKRNHYAYALEGLTKDWVDLGERHDVTFTDLPPGRYRFDVRASNADGVWTSRAQTSLTLVVPPPFWATGWFRLAAAAAALGLLYAGHRSHVRGLQRDLQRRRETEQVLRNAEEKYRELVEDIGEVLFSALPEGRITYISPVIESLLERPRSDVVGASLETLIGPEGMEKVRTAVGDPSSSPTIFCEHQLAVGAGEPKWLRISTRVVWQGGKVTGLRGVITDITEFKRLEGQVRQSQKMDAIGQLAGGIAHDFNNLLTAIIGYTDMLLEERLTEGARMAGLKEIRSASHRAATLTRQLLAFSRQQVLQPQIVDLNVLLVEMEKMLQRLIGDNILLAIMLNRSPAVVRADPGQLQQIVLNLAINARDAMPAGGRLLIQTGEHRTEAGAEEILLLVSDTGTGMTPEVKARLFEPFFTTKGVGKGTGLGLSTVYGIVQQSQGRIDVSTTHGHGSAFRIYLPQVRAPAPAVSAAAPSGPLEAPPGLGSLLVVEDNDSVAGVLRRLLAKSGAEVLFASSAEEALALCERRGAPIDLLLTDVVMPGLNGRELADELKKRYPRLRVLFMSGYADDVVSGHGAIAPDHRFLQKPFTQDELFREMAAAIAARTESA